MSSDRLVVKGTDGSAILEGGASLIRLQIVAQRLLVSTGRRSTW